MAMITDAFSTYVGVGIREDIDGIIHDISPLKFPFLSSAPRTKAKARLHETQTDALAAPDTGNARFEGNVAVAAAVTPTVRVGNVCQISDKVFVITGTMEAVEKAGRKSEVAYQKMRHARMLKRDQEAILLNNQASVTGGITTARVLGGFPAWLTSNVSRGGGSPAGANGGHSSPGVIAIAVDAGTTRNLSETLVKGVLQTQYDNGGEPDTVMVRGVNKVNFSAFTGGATKFDKTEDSTLYTSVDFYKSDWGTIKVVPNRFMRVRDLLILQTDMAAVAYLRPYQFEQLAKTGDGWMWTCRAEYTLEMRNEKAHGVVADLTATIN